jgi:hypothetical protein
MARAVITKEEKAKIVAEYKAKKAAELKEEKAEEAERAAIEKAKSPEQKKEEAAAKKKADAEKKAADKAAAEADKKVRAEAKAKEKAYLATLSKEDQDKYLADKKAKEKACVDSAFEEYKVKHAQEVGEKRAALEARYDTGAIIHLFFFNMGQSKFCQGYMNWWRKLNIAHPTLGKWLYQIFFFIVFSEGVTIWQYLLLTFLPMSFGIGLAGTEFMWPKLLMGQAPDGTLLYWNILGYTIKYEGGAVAIGGGLGYFIAFEIATFTAQCINFPLQRNITYKSHGNPWYQAMWYFIGWVAISFLCNAINGLWIPFAQVYLNPALYNILVMVATGGISMVIFFFIFRIIFPAGSASDDKKEVKKTETTTTTQA